MNAEFQIRRATVDDLPELMNLWRAAQFPTDLLEKRFTEFQVAEAPDGTLAGIAAIQVSGREGLLHGETFADFSLTDRLRPLLWERLQAVARNYGLVHLWTQETAPFWKKEVGFAEAPEEQLSKLPPAFRNADGNWLVLRLRDEAALLSAEDEFARFKEAERQESEKTLAQARALKTVAATIATAVVIFVLWGAFHLLKRGF